MLFNSEVNLAFLSLHQRLLNDLWWTRLSRRRAIWLFPLSRHQSSLFLSLPVCRRSSLLTGEGVGEEHFHTTAKILVLQKSFNALWSPHLLLFGLRTESVFVNLLRAQESTPGRPVRQPCVSYRPASLHRLAESIPGFLKRLHGF